MKRKPEIEFNSNPAQNLATIEVPHVRYVNHLLKKRCYEELSTLFLRVDNPAKEISESVAALIHMRKYVNAENITCYHIGDGGSPRTAATFSYIFKNTNISIDPAMYLPFVNKWFEQWKPDRLYIDSKKWEDTSYIKKTGRYNFILVHAHVDVEEIDKTYNKWEYIYTNPCCMPEKQTFSEQYLIENNIEKIHDSNDFGILSDKRRVVIYKNNRI